MQIATSEQQAFGALPSSRSSTTSCAAGSFLPTLEQQTQTPTKKWSGETLRLSVRILPPFYPLSPTYATIGNSLEVIGANLEECFRTASLYCRYGSSGIWLQTPERVEIQINLWKRRDDDDVVLAELSCLAGDVIVFHRYARCILNAASGDFSQTRHLAKGRAGLTGIFQEPTSSSVTMTQATQALEITSTMLSNPHSQLMGMEMLSILTDVSKSSLQTCQMTSRMVLFGECHTCTAMKQPEIANTVQKWVQAKMGAGEDSSVVRHMDNDSDAEDDDLLEGRGNREWNAMKHFALTIFTNALEVLQHDHALQGWTDAALSRSNGNSIFCHLVEEEMTQTLNRPHDACLAIRSLSITSTCSDTLKRQLSQSWILKDIFNALDVGRNCHENLEFECMKLLDALGASTVFEQT